jgi:hypothetical protein
MYDLNAMQNGGREFQDRGGASIGYSRYPWPFAIFKADAERIQLLCGPENFEFPRFSLVRLSRLRIFSKGLLIEHTLSAAPHYIVFWSFNYKNLAASLRRLGYEVVGKTMFIS